MAGRYPNRVVVAREKAENKTPFLDLEIREDYDRLKKLLSSN